MFKGFLFTFLFLGVITGILLFFVVGHGHTCGQLFLLTPCLGITQAQGPCSMLEIEFRQTTCKASTLPALLLFKLKIYDLYKKDSLLEKRSKNGYQELRYTRYKRQGMSFYSRLWKLLLAPNLGSIRFKEKRINRTIDSQSQNVGFYPTV